MELQQQVNTCSSQAALQTSPLTVEHMSFQSYGGEPPIHGVLVASEALSLVGLCTGERSSKV